MSVVEKIFGSIHAFTQRRAAAAQQLALHEKGVIPANQKLAAGFKDAGPTAYVDANGGVRGKITSPIVVVPDGAEDDFVQGARSHALSMLIGKTTLVEKLDCLRRIVDEMMPDHSRDENIEGRWIKKPIWEPGKEIFLTEIAEMGCSRPIDCALMLKLICDQIDHPELKLSVHRGTLIDSRGTYRDHYWNEVRDGHGDRIIVDVFEGGTFHVDDKNVERYADGDLNQLYETSRKTEYIHGY